MVAAVEASMGGSGLEDMELEVEFLAWKLGSGSEELAGKNRCDWTQKSYDKSLVLCSGAPSQTRRSQDRK